MENISICSGWQHLLLTFMAASCQASQPSRSLMVQRDPQKQVKVFVCSKTEFTTPGEDSFRQS